MLVRSVHENFLNDVLADAKAIRMYGALRGHVYVPASTSLTSISWYGSMERDGVFALLNDSAGNLIASSGIDGTAGVYQIPAGVLGVPFVKAVGNADASGVKMSVDYDSSDV